jgi:hypothetical protein
MNRVVVQRPAHIAVGHPGRRDRRATTSELPGQVDPSGVDYEVVPVFYPLVDEDLEATDLPRPVRGLAGRCFGLTTTVARLSRVRQERRPDSRYAS